MQSQHFILSRYLYISQLRKDWRRKQGCERREPRILPISSRKWKPRMDPSVGELLISGFINHWASLVTVKNPRSMQETWARTLGWEDPLEKGMAAHSCFLAWRIPMDRGTWWATTHGVAELDMTERLSRACQPFKWEIKTKGRDFPGGSVVKNLPANAGDTGREPRTRCGVTRTLCHDYWACAVEPGRQVLEPTPGAYGSLCIPEPVLRKKRSHRSEHRVPHS